MVGILSLGSSTCRDDDKYVRLDNIRDWLKSVLGPPVANPPDCGTVTEKGRCLYGSALWCS